MEERRIDELRRRKERVVEAYLYENALDKEPYQRHLGSNASRLWIQAGLDQRQRRQKVFFPEGVTFDGREFRTPLTCPFFSDFEGTSGSSESLVAHSVTSSNPAWKSKLDSNRIYAWLHQVAALRQAA